MVIAAQISIPNRKLKSLVNDTAKSAAAVHLTYVSDSQPGITRVKKGKQFVYLKDGEQITDPDLLRRILSLVLPPAWRQVWICPDPSGHLQATGLDALNRKQYRYHPLWNSLRNHTKYFNLLDFGKALPSVRAQLDKDLSLPGLPMEKVLAAVVSVMQCTCMRIGSSVYEKLYGSFGLTTLKDQHVQISGQQMQFSFKGKKGIYHSISLKSRKLARIVQACKDIPGKELFQYYDESGTRRSIDSGMVNSYIKSVSGGNFTAKDFRTWAGSVHALNAFMELGCCDTEAEAKKRIVEVIDSVAAQLGNTRTVCRKYYVHPALIDLYTSGELGKFLKKQETEDCGTGESGLSSTEQLLMNILGSL